MLLTRAPLYSRSCPRFLVRLACVRHAASVDSEPGSNSRLKPVVSRRSQRDGISRIIAICTLHVVRSLELNSSPSHDWHVQPIVKDRLALSALGGGVPVVGDSRSHHPSSNFVLRRLNAICGARTVRALSYAANKTAQKSRELIEFKKDQLEVSAITAKTLREQCSRICSVAGAIRSLWLI